MGKPCSIQKEAAHQANSCVHFFCVWVASWLQGYNNQLPGDICTWRVPGNNCEADERIWIILDKVFRDAGFTLWPNVAFSSLKIADYPSSSGFGYAIPTRRKGDGVGSLALLREFEYNVCTFICLFIPCLIFKIESTPASCTYPRWIWCHHPRYRHREGRAWPSENSQDSCNWREQPAEH